MAVSQRAYCKAQLEPAYMPASDLYSVDHSPRQSPPSRPPITTTLPGTCLDEHPAPRSNRLSNPPSDMAKGKSPHKASAYHHRHARACKLCAHTAVHCDRFLSWSSAQACELPI